MMQTTTHSDGSRWNLAAKFACAMFLAIGAFLLVTEHRAHVVSYLPWVLVAVCPILHFLMHGRRGHRHGPMDEPQKGDPPGHPTAGEQP